MSTEDMAARAFITRAASLRCLHLSFYKFLIDISDVCAYNYCIYNSCMRILCAQAE